MKRYLLLMVVFMATISVFSQEADSLATKSVAFRFGSVSYNQLLLSMPEYSKMETDMAELKKKYDAEMKASEQEFNAKYEIFLAEQSNYAPSILRKRQSELEEMMKRNEQFRLESLRLLDQAREEMLAPVRKHLDEIISAVAMQYQLAFVLNTDSDAVPFLNPQMAYDINDAVKIAIVVGIE